MVLVRISFSEKSKKALYLGLSSEDKFFHSFERNRLLFNESSLIRTAPLIFVENQEAPKKNELVIFYKT